MVLHKAARRIEWIDYARGLCIVLVVLLYANDFVEEATGRQGWVNAVVEFARPFRMPDFFLISGLLLSRTIGRPWPLYLDRKVAHFGYFYALWLVIAYAAFAPSMAAHGGWQNVLASFGHSLLRPFYWLWFIYMLPLFFVATKLAQRMPRAALWTAAAALHVADVQSGIKVLDKFSEYYVFFYTGYAFAPHAFAIARSAQSWPQRAMAVLCGWALFEAYVVAAGYSHLPLFSLAVAFIGIAAVVAASALMPRSRLFVPLRYCGENSIVIYLSFFFPATATRVALTKSGWIADVGAMVLLVTLAGVVGALLLYWSVRKTPLSFLFERPAWLQITSAPSRSTGAAAQTPTSPF